MDEPEQEVISSPFTNEITIKLGLPYVKQVDLTFWAPLGHDNIDANQIAITINEKDANWEFADLAEYFVWKLRPSIPKNFCFHCTRIFENESDLEEHLNCEGITIPTEFKTYNMGKPLPILFQFEHLREIMICLICNQHTRGEDHFQQHLAAHKRWQIPYHCTQCPFLADHFRLMMDHNKQEHYTMVFCPFCLEKMETGGLATYWYERTQELQERVITEVVNVYDHVKGHIESDRKFGCHKCLVSFLNADKLENHKKIHKNPLLG